MTGALALGVCVCGGLLPCPCRHLIVHPYPQQGCPQCRQPAACVWCGLSEAECPSWLGHAEAHRSSETTWRLLAAHRGVGAA